VILSYESKGFSRIDIDTNGSNPIYSLAGQLTGLPLKSLQGFGVPAESYGFANRRLPWETVAPLLDRASPLRTAHLRDPVGPQILATPRTAGPGGPFRGEAISIEIASSPSVLATRLPPALSEGAARHRRRQGGGRACRMGAAAVTEA
jgi:hypothetical protein